MGLEGAGGDSSAAGAGDLSRTLTIVTDLAGDSTAELAVKATVVMPKAE